MGETELRGMGRRKGKREGRRRGRRRGRVDGVLIAAVSGRGRGRVASKCGWRGLGASCLTTRQSGAGEMTCAGVC